MHGKGIGTLSTPEVLQFYCFETRVIQPSCVCAALHSAGCEGAVQQSEVTALVLRRGAAVLGQALQRASG